MRDRNADGVGGDLVVADRHDGAARAAVNEIQHEEQRHEDEHDARGEGRNFGNARYADRTVDDHLAAVAELEILLDQAEMQAVRIPAEVHDVDDVLDDLTEGEGYDGEVVALEAEYRHADDDAGERRKDRADDHGNSQTQRSERDGVREAGRGDDAGERAYRHEAGMAERQLAEDADGQVERDRHDDIRADRHEQALDLARDHAARDERLYDDECGDDDTERKQGIASASGRRIGF